MQSSLVFTASGVALGALAAVPMFVYGLYLGTRHWPWLETSRTKSATGGQQLRFFGRNRQVSVGGLRVDVEQIPGTSFKQPRLRSTTSLLSLHIVDQLASTTRFVRMSSMTRGKRKVAKVMVVSVPLAALVGFCEECVYRGFFPLLLASKIRLPLAAVVALSAVFCGVRSCGS